MKALLTSIFGHWQAPPWMRWLKEHPIKFAVVLLIGCALWQAWDWYESRPKPQTVQFQLTQPELTNYEAESLQFSPLVIRFDTSVAPLDKVGEPITQGVKLSPNLAGQWRWASDKHLQFQPDEDWPADKTYQVDFDKDVLFTSGILLDKSKVDFNTAPFLAKIVEARLYQDPTLQNVQKLVATINFSHPVNKNSVRNTVSVLLSPGLTYREVRDYELSFDARGVNAYIHSAPLVTPLEPGKVTIEIGKGLKAASGGNASSQSQQEVAVQGLYQLAFSSANIRFAFNDKEEPEPIVTFESSNPVSDEALANKVQAWLLPYQDQRGDKYWNRNKLTDSVLRQSSKVNLIQNPSADDFSSLHSFKVDVPVGRYIAVKIAKNIEGQGGYLSRDDQYFVVRMPDYPKSLSFLGEGALLSLNDDLRVGYSVRGVDSVKIEIAQLLPDQIHQLVGQNSGILTVEQFDNAAFDRLVTRQEEIQDFANDPAKIFYGHINLKPYLKHKRGIFVLKLSPANERDNTTFDYYKRDTRDLRFIMMTDLGMLAKRSIDGSLDIFVQSLSQGDAVAGAKVDVVGRNGISVMTGFTNEEGHVHLPALNDLRREKTPLFYRVEKAGDVSFLPINDWRRRLDMSRFDVGGSHEATDPNKLDAYLFTERGLYRPGEKVHLASIVRSQSWQAKLKGLPVRMRITDPRGVTVLERTSNLDASGFGGLDYQTSEVAAAGDYTATLFLNSGQNRRTRLGETQFKVRDFEPDRIKVRVALKGEDDKQQLGWLKPEEVKATVKAEQLFGGPAGERRVTGDMVLSPTNIRFDQWPNYHFGVVGNLKDLFRETLTETQTDTRGMAELTLDLDRFGDTTFSLHLLAKVYEGNSGRGVSGQDKQLVSSADRLLGYKADGDLGFISKGGERHLNLVVIGQDLTPRSAKLTIERIEKRWVSVLVKQRDGTYKYESRRKDIPLDTQDVQLMQGKLDLLLNTAVSGDYRLRITDEAGRQLNQIDYTVAGKGNANRTLERDAELQLKLNKSEYRPGEMINISIQSPYTGSGLITIERDKVYSFKWFKMDSSRSVQSIQLPEGIEGNAYINVQFVRAADSNEIFMSPLSYAVEPFKVDLGERRQALSLKLPEKVKPGEQVRAKLTLPQPAKVVVFGVNEGILQTARYETPDPLAHFFTKKALTVNSSQILDLLLPDLATIMRNAAPGGDDEASALLAANLNPFKRKRIEPVVYWSGFTQLTEGTFDFSYSVPDTFNGNMRFFAVAVTEQSIGVAQEDLKVKAPVVMSPNVPAFLVPGDEAEITLGLYNTEPNPVSVSVDLMLEGGLTQANAQAQTFDIRPGQEVTARFNLKAIEPLGEAKLRWKLTTPQGDFSMRETISIRPQTAHRVQLKMGILERAEKTVALERNLYQPFSEVETGLHNSPIIWAYGLIDYLDNYAHNCTEQMVSKVVPTIRFGDVQRTKSSFDAMISQLRSRQNNQGAFGTWAANLVVEPMVTLYVVDMLLDAKARGFNVPKDMLDKANSYLSGLSGSPSSGLNELRQRAYGSYLLARQGVTVSGAVADIRERLQRYYPEQWQSDIASAWLAASFTLMKQDSSAKALWDAQSWDMLKKAPKSYAMYSDPLVHDAQLLSLLSRYAPERMNDLPDNLIEQMGLWLSSQRYSSLSAATLIRGLADYEAHRQDRSQQLTMMAKVADQWQQKVLPKSKLAYGTEAVKFQKSGNDKAFYLVTEIGFDKQALEPFSQGLEVVRDYLDLDGKPITSLTLGQEFLVRLRLRATAMDKLEQVVMIDMLPGGVEPVYRDKGEQFNGWQPPVGVSEQTDWSPSWANVREDRVVLYGNATRDVSTFTYKARALNAGRFQVPPAYVEGMYDPLQQAQGATSELVITAP